MTEKQHQPCPHPGCGSSDAFSYNTEKMVGKCFSCDEKYPQKGVVYTQEFLDRYPNKLGVGFDAPVPSHERAGSDAEYSFVASRGITTKTMEHYGVRTLLNGKGEPIQQEYVYPSGGKKIRRLPKSFSAYGLKSDELFGMNLYPSGVAKIVTITEGELDALSVWQMIQRGGFPTPVVSLPSASPSKALWDNVKGWLDGFDKIVLSIDTDDAGDGVAEKINNMFPNKVYRVDHGDFKDANDFLRLNKQQEFKNLWWNAKKWVPDNILHSADDLLKLYTDTPQHSYVPTGIEALDDKAMGLMQGHFTLFKAPTGIGKSLAPKTKVLKYNGDVVRADEVLVGDRLMGPDGNPRNVTNVNLQYGPMYRVTPVKGEPFECNADHILSLRHTSTGEIKNVVLTDYLSWSKTQKHLWKLWRTGVDTFGPYSLTNPSFAYAVGVYLGDGHTHGPALSMGKKKEGVANALLESGYLKPTSITFDRGCFRYGMSTRSTLWDYLSNHTGQSENCLIERKIPSDLKTGRGGTRRAVLAGLLDTDGSVTPGGAEITQKSELLADDICFVARSLGLAAYKKDKVVNGVIYHRVTISGDLTVIPCVRLKFKPRKQIKNVLNTGFSVEPIGGGIYRGIMLDGDHLFLLGDFTVTHNTELMRYLEWNFIQRGVTFASWHLEETKLRSLLGLVSYDLKDNLTRKDLVEEKGVEDAVRESIKGIADGGHYYQYYLKEESGADELLSHIRLMATAYECKYVMVEPIQDVINIGSEDSKESALASLAVSLSRLAADLNIGIISIAHTNDDGEIKYCRMLGQRASVIIRLDRDKDVEDFQDRNTTKLILEKNRPCSEEGRAGNMLFDPSTFTMEEI